MVKKNENYLPNDDRKITKLFLTNRI